MSKKPDTKQPQITPLMPNGMFRQHIGIVGQTGSGKTYAAKSLVELDRGTAKATQTLF